jgi:hypothetical protein
MAVDYGGSLLPSSLPKMRYMILPAERFLRMPIHPGPAKDLTYQDVAILKLRQNVTNASPSPLLDPHHCHAYPLEVCTFLLHHYISSFRPLLLLLQGTLSASLLYLEFLLF